MEHIKPQVAPSGSGSAVHGTGINLRNVIDVSGIILHLTREDFTTDMCLSRYKSGLRTSRQAKFQAGGFKTSDNWSLILKVARLGYLSGNRDAGKVVSKDVLKCL